LNTVINRNDTHNGDTCDIKMAKVGLVCWCLTTLSAQIGYRVMGV